MGFAGPLAADKKLRAAFIYVGPIGDGGWTYAHNDGREALEKLNVQTAFVEAGPKDS